MPKACVQHVKKLRIAPWINSAQQSTVGSLTSIHLKEPWVKAQLIRKVTQQLFAQLSTYKNSFSPLMNTFFTQFPQHLLLKPLKEN
jgi:hypothetical protein